MEFQIDNYKKIYDIRHLKAGFPAWLSIRFIDDDDDYFITLACRRNL